MDFVFALMLGGNDFVPSIEFLKIRNGGWEIIHSNFLQFQHPLIDMNNLSVIWEHVIMFFMQLVKLEEGTLRSQHIQRQNQIHKPSEDLYHHGFFSNPKHPLYDQYGKQSLRSIIYRNEYYEHIFGNFDELFIQTMCKEFLTSIRWCWEYYIYGNVMSWDFYYPYIAGPRLEDVLTYFKDPYSTSFDTSMSKHVFSPLEQMLCVLPKRSLKLLPENIRYVMEDENMNPLEHWYEHDDVLLEPITGQKMIYTNRFLPDICTSDAVLLADICYSTLTKSEIHRCLLE
jgi:5'-3' exonuclease